MKRIRTAIGAFVCCLFLFSRESAGQELEYQVKAEFLERFTRFIEWPVDSLVSDQKTPFRLCVMGKNPFGAYLKEMADEVRIKGKRVNVLELTDPAQSEGCDLVFVSSGEAPNLRAILQHTDSKPILTVGDTVDFARNGVLINLIKSESRIVFEMNLDAVKRSRLRFSSRLMGLARQVKENRGE